MADLGNTLLEVLALSLSNGAVYALLAVGLVLVYRTTRVINFAQAEAGTVAMYGSWALHNATGLPSWLTAIFGIAVVGVIGYGFERFVARPMLGGGRLPLSVATLGLFSLLGFLPVIPWGVAGQFPPALLDTVIEGGGIRLGGVFLDTVRLASLAIAIVLAGSLWWLLNRTTFGLGMMAAADDPQTLRLMGVKLHRVTSFTWVLAMVLGGVAGILILTSTAFFEPFQMTTFFVRGLAAALLGGLTSLSGAIVGGLAIGVLEQLVERMHLLPFVENNPPGLVEAGLLAIILTVLLVRPQGLMGRPDSSGGAA